MEAQKPKQANNNFPELLFHTKKLFFNSPKLFSIFIAIIRANFKIIIPRPFGHVK